MTCSWGHFGTHCVCFQSLWGEFSCRDWLSQLEVQFLISFRPSVESSFSFFPFLFFFYFIHCEILNGYLSCTGCGSLGASSGVGDQVRALFLFNFWFYISNFLLLFSLSSFNFQLSTFNFQLSTFNFQLSTFVFHFLSQFLHSFLLSKSWHEKQTGHPKKPDKTLTNHQHSLSFSSSWCLSAQGPDQDVLIAIWKGLTNNGALRWNTGVDLCGQNGVICSPALDGKVLQLWVLLPFSSFDLPWILSHCQLGFFGGIN